MTKRITQWRKPSTPSPQLAHWRTTERIVPSDLPTRTRGGAKLLGFAVGLAIVLALAFCGYGGSL